MEVILVLLFGCSTYSIAHVVVASAVHVDVAPLLEDGGLYLWGVALCREGNETSACLDRDMVLKIEKHFDLILICK